MSLFTAHQHSLCYRQKLSDLKLTSSSPPLFHPEIFVFSFVSIVCQERHHLGHSLAVNVMNIFLLYSQIGLLRHILSILLGGWQESSIKCAGQRIQTFGLSHKCLGQFQGFSACLKAGNFVPVCRCVWSRRRGGGGRARGKGWLLILPICQWQKTRALTWEEKEATETMWVGGALKIPE